MLAHRLAIALRVRNDGGVAHVGLDLAKPREHIGYLRLFDHLRMPFEK